jgi:hypothetical protein
VQVPPDALPIKFCARWRLSCGCDFTLHFHGSLPDYLYRNIIDHSTSVPLACSMLPSIEAAIDESSGGGDVYEQLKSMASHGRDETKFQAPSDGYANLIGARASPCNKLCPDLITYQLSRRTVQNSFVLFRTRSSEMRELLIDKYGSPHTNESIEEGIIIRYRLRCPTHGQR